MPAAVEYIWKSDQTRVGTDMRYPDRPKNGGQDVVGERGVGGQGGVCGGGRGGG